MDRLMNSQIDPSLLPTSAAWQKIGMRPHHGICLPLFSIRNPTSSGIGEFLDLLPLIDWCQKIGFDVIQLLPLNDSGGDSSPYSAHSAMALHPIYLSLAKLPFVEAFAEELLPLRKCNSSKRVRYDQVLKAKEAFLERYATVALPKIRETSPYQEFLKNNSWLAPYALYKTLKRKNDECAWWDWPKEEQTYDERLLSTYEREVEYHQFIQFLCFEQLAAVKKAAEEAKVFLKGDIPILINRDSADVWQRRELFSLKFAAGAPPDMYSEEGQYWGFPLYNWDVLEKDGYQWWKERLNVAANFYHIYRLDHIVGFFKIWAIPDGKKAKEGFFIPEDPNLWIPQGEKILRALCQNPMLPIGEDLGAVPPSVRDCMKRLGIAGTKVMRWERRWDTDKSFILPSDYPPLSMTTLSTHDSEPLGQWWQEFPDEAEKFALAMRILCPQPLDSQTRIDTLRLSHQSQSLFHINLLQEYLDVFEELSWENPEDDRINIPGKVLDRNWTYRFYPTLETICEHQGLRTLMQELMH